MKNLGIADRVIRVFLAELCVIAAFFWRTGEWQILLYLVAVVLLVQAATGVCGLYNLLHWNTCEIVKRRNKNLGPVVLILALLIAVVGGYASAIITKNIFLQDLKSFQEPCSQTIGSLEKGEQQEALASWERMNSSFSALQIKYSGYRPVAVRYDGQFSGDMQNITPLIRGSKEDIGQGNLTQARKDLLQVDAIIEEMKIRDGLS